MQDQVTIIKAINELVSYATMENKTSLSLPTGLEVGDAVVQYRDVLVACGFEVRHFKQAKLVRITWG
jgi:hypothetical protein